MSFYVPSGFKLLKTAYLEFVLVRFKGELKELWEDYASIHRPVLYKLPEGPNPRETWQGRIEHRYSGTEALSPLDAPTEVLPSKLTAHKLHQEYLRNLRYGEISRHLSEDGDYSSEPTSFDRCMDLLEGGIGMYWQRKKEELANVFREAFIDGSRQASVLAADGTQTPIPPAWWCGSQCTEALVTLSCQHPLGDIIEEIDPAPVKTAAANDKDAPRALASIEARQPPEQLRGRVRSPENQMAEDALYDHLRDEGWSGVLADLERWLEDWFERKGDISAPAEATVRRIAQGARDRWKNQLPDN